METVAGLHIKRLKKRIVTQKALSWIMMFCYLVFCISSGIGIYDQVMLGQYLNCFASIISLVVASATAFILWNIFSKGVKEAQATISQWIEQEILDVEHS